MNCDFIDLGLPSGTLWCNKNIGAESQYDSGLYFSYGSIEGKSKDSVLDKKDFSWDDYKFALGQMFKITKYTTDYSYSENGTSDNFAELLPDDDIATVLYGNGYKTPSLEDFNELFEYTIQFFDREHNCVVFRASNGNEITLFPGGFIGNGHLHDYGNCGDYLSSTLSEELNNCSYKLYFRPPNYFEVTPHQRFYGVNVRPVKK